MPRLMRMTALERGVWERAYQRVRKRLERAGEAPEIIREAASRAAAETVEAVRAGEPEPDFGRRRSPPEVRGEAMNNRRAAYAQIVTPVSEATLSALRDEAARNGVTLNATVRQIVERWATRRRRREA